MLFYLFVAIHFTSRSIRSPVYNFGVVPASLLGSKEGYLPETLTIFTSMFMHGGWFHLMGKYGLSLDLWR
ncbi:MAG: hypothetical protein Ct9H300mP3_00120 [Gammaproteobacteria bacterium]|nr:MAG: hypothetical protein Ct9H300mP3_00120 [Gammaproteobacteria bacterium]